MRLLLTFGFALALSQLSIAAENWPQFRGPTGDGIAPGSGFPTEWSETKNVLWKTPIHDKGWSSPVIWGEQIWLTTAKEDGTELFAVCLNRADGKVLRDIKLFSVKDPPDVRKYNSFATPTPVIEAGRVYLHFGTHGTACLDTKTAEVLWKREDLPCNHFRGAASSPVLFEKKLHLTFDGYDQQYVVALDAETGKTAWKKDRAIKFKSDNGDMKKAFATPSILEVDGKPQLVSPAAEATIAYNPTNGDELWRIAHGGMNEACRPVLTNGLIILSSGHTSNLLAVKAGKKGELGKDAIAWEFAKQAPSKPSVLAVKDHLSFVNDSGVAYCLDAKTGTKVWQERLDGAFAASPTLADGVIYFPSENGTTTVVKADPKFQLVKANKLADGCRATPAFADGKIYLRTYTHLYCIGAK
jgi:outer membrane protein assembly factor BamB